MITAEQARVAQHKKQAELAAIAEAEAEKQAEQDQATAKALAENNIVLSKEIVEKAHQNIEKASSEGESEVTFYAGHHDTGAYDIACDLLGKLGFKASRVYEEVVVPMNDPDMQGIRDYKQATGDMKVSWDV